MKTAIPGQRLQNQRITRAGHRQPADVVAWLGAVQAQEYPAARWGLALRMPPGTTDAEIERAVDERRILRTHVMRPTWHFVTPGDIRWLLALTAPRVRAILARDDRALDIEGAVRARCAPEAMFDATVQRERDISASIGGRTVFDGPRRPRAATGQLSLFGR